MVQASMFEIIHPDVMSLRGLKEFRLLYTNLFVCVVDVSGEVSTGKLQEFTSEKSIEFSSFKKYGLKDQQ